MTYLMLVCRAVSYGETAGLKQPCRRRKVNPLDLSEKFYPASASVGFGRLSPEHSLATRP